MAHLILIEPDRVLAETYSQALRAAGHSVTPCASAQAAILAADQQTPDIVVCELQLIDHSGIEFLYEFRSYDDWRTVPVLLHTSVPVAEFNRHRQILQTELGITTHLYKPATTLQRLISEIEANLSVPA